MLMNGDPFSLFMVPSYNNRVSLIDQSQLMEIVDHVRDPEPKIVRILVKAVRKAGHRVDRKYLEHIRSKVGNFVVVRPVVLRAGVTPKTEYVHTNNFLNSVFTYPAQPSLWAAIRHLIG